MGKRTRQSPAFTLIELLVVVSIIALLVAILLPSLSRARSSAKLAVCASNLRQMGCGIHVYSQGNIGLIPHGPPPAYDYDFSSNAYATNQLWIGGGLVRTSSEHPQQYTGAGLMLPLDAPDPKVYFCPADDQFNLSEELPKIGTLNDAYGSYLYRQLDQLPDSPRKGRLDAMGSNWVNNISVPVEALGLDANSLGTGELRHTNHSARMVNIMFRDGSVSAFHNVNNVLALPESCLVEWITLPGAIDQLLTNADHGYHGLPQNAPQIEEPGGSGCKGETKPY